MWDVLFQPYFGMFFVHPPTHRSCLARQVEKAAMMTAPMGTDSDEGMKERRDRHGQREGEVLGYRRMKKAWPVNSPRIQ